MCRGMVPYSHLMDGRWWRLVFRSKRPLKLKSWMLRLRIFENSVEKTAEVAKARQMCSDELTAAMAVLLHCLELAAGYKPTLHLLKMC